MRMRFFHVHAVFSCEREGLQERQALLSLRGHLRICEHPDRLVTCRLALLV